MDNLKVNPVGPLVCPHPWVWAKDAAHAIEVMIWPQLLSPDMKEFPDVPPETKRRQIIAQHFLSRMQTTRFRPIFRELQSNGIEKLEPKVPGYWGTPEGMNAFLEGGDYPIGRSGLFAYFRPLLLREQDVRMLVVELDQLGQFPEPEAEQEAASVAHEPPSSVVIDHDATHSENPAPLTVESYLDDQFGDADEVPSPDVIRAKSSFGVKGSPHYISQKAFRKRVSDWRRANGFPAAAHGKRNRRVRK